jgi:hypothetical protein
MKIFEIISEESESSDKPVVFPSGNKITTGVFAKNLAQYFHGLNAWTNRSFHRTKWTMSRGGAYYDPEWNVQFDNLDDRDDAWQDIKQRAQLVHTKDPYNRECEPRLHRIIVILRCFMVGKQCIFGKSAFFAYTPMKPILQIYLIIKILVMRQLPIFTFFNLMNFALSNSLRFDWCLWDIRWF